jgi:hypothetical protein
MVGKRDWWFALALLLFVSFAPAAPMLLERRPQVYADLYRMTRDAPGLLAVLVMGPALLLFLVLWACWELRAGQWKSLSGELDNLLQKKHSGLLLQSARKPRPARACGARLRPARRGGYALIEPARLLPTAGLDRLWQKKRTGAWSPPTHPAAR